MNKIIPLLILITHICNAKSAEEYFEPFNAVMDRVNSKESYTRNDIRVIIVLREIDNSEILMGLSEKEKLSDLSLTTITLSINAVYANIIPKDLNFTDKEIKIIKSYIDRSGKYLSQNMSKHKASERIKKLHNIAYEHLVLAAEQFDHKVEESKQLLQRFKKK